MNLPSFALLRRNYITDHNPAVILHTIGGTIGNLSETRTNTCVIRMSRAFNYAGAQYELPSNQKVPPLRTLPGKDRKNYAYNVHDFLGYLGHRYGPPMVSNSYKVGEKESATPFLGKTGIIAWLIEGWSDATGHFTLWDGKTGLYEGEHDYFSDFPIEGVDPQGKKRVIRETAAKLWVC